MKSAIVTILAILSCIFAAKVRGEEAITKADSKEILSYLASDELEGRGTGQEGNAKAARFIANKFKEYGLERYDEHGYFQHFTYPGVRGLRPLERPLELLGVVGSRVTINAVNVVGVIRGKTSKCILFGAHFDHLGIKKDTSLFRTGKDKIYNGADDNASGTTGLLELAEAFGKSGKKPHHTLVFVAFGAEEIGLIGSRYYANYPVLPLKNHKLMINLDMIGRLKESKKEWRGLSNAVQWNKVRKSKEPVTLDLQSGNLSKKIKDLIYKLDDNYPFRFKLSIAGWRSDHAEFNSQGVPVLFFHTGEHPQYHQTTDDEHLINYEGLVNITKFVFNLVDEIEESVLPIAPPPPLEKE